METKVHKNLAGIETCDFLENTLERMVPERSGEEAFWAHLYRYRFAKNYVKGKSVLDIACGEGYGSSGFQKAGASNVISIDCKFGVCSHAQKKYGKKRIATMVGNAEDIPIGDGSIDVIVSFETIEHLYRPDIFITEIVRVLKKNGIAIISTPNSDMHSQENKNSNPFHCSELSYNEFISLLEKFFVKYSVFSQQSVFPRISSIEQLFIAKNSALLKIRGMWRVRLALQSIFCRHIIGAPKRIVRFNADEFVKKNNSFGECLFNQYAVRSETEQSARNAEYIIAVAIAA
jgi:2-polyprenyl-3-methyl-5-hydroxy-6-metoxy-1,4-benzoquinol methylase